jgi:hypothetical protein
MSINEPHADSDVSEFESALAGLRPQCSRINRDRLLFEAGRAESLRQVCIGRRILGLGAGAAFLAAAFGLMLVDARRQLGDLEIALQTRSAPPVAARERSKIPDPSAARGLAPENPRVAPLPPTVAAGADPSAGRPRVSSAVTVRSIAEWPPRYAGLRHRGLRPGYDILADASQGVDPRHPPRAGDGPRTNVELRQKYLQHAAQQPVEFEALLRGLPIQEGERS